jgi:heme-degrading monooxygenase HmoA
MTELVTTGTWRVNPTKEAAFVQAWAAFAEWASSMPGAVTLRLGRDVGAPLRFVSYGAWQDTDSVRAWKSAPQFRERIARVLQYVDDFQPAELDVVATAADGSSIVTLPARIGVE